MNKKVLIYSSYVLIDRHFGTDLELARKHLQEGDEVHFLVCDTSLLYCELNYEHTLERCTNCILKTNRGLKLLNIPPGRVHRLQLNKYRDKVTIPDFHSLAELKAFTYEKVDIGLTAASTLISSTGDSKPDVRKFRKAVENLIITSVSLYEGVKAFLSGFEPDIFYLFNARTSARRPALRAAQAIGIKTFVHESAGVMDKYDLSEDTYPHDLVYIKKHIEEHWLSNPNEKEKERLAREWFNDQRSGRDQSYYSFVKKQQVNLLPSDLNKHILNIAIYNSSEDEMEAVDPIWKETAFNGQNRVIAEICQSFAPENIRFYLRVHPYLQGKNTEQTREISRLRFPNLTVIPADSPIDTYALMEACHKVITFGSTTGIEASFYARPSILLGRAVYEDSGACYQPKTMEEALDLVMEPHLAPLSREGALKYAYWQKTRGYKYKYYRPTGMIEGNFAGYDLNELRTTKAELSDIQLLYNKMFLHAKPDINRIIDEMKKRKASGLGL